MKGNVKKMTDRHTWEVGSSSSTIGAENHNGEGFELYRRAGIKYAEFSVNDENCRKLGFFEDPCRLVKIAKEHGVEFWSFHIPFSGLLNPANLDPERNKLSMEILESYTRAALKAGFRTLVLHPSSEPNKEEERQAQIERSTENMAYLAKICAEDGAMLAIEDLPRTCLGNCSFDILTFLNSIPEAGLCFDTNHLTMQPNLDFLDDLIDNGMAGRIRTLHVSDYDFIDERHRLPGDGINDWNGIFDRLEKLDYNGVFMYEVSRMPKERDEVSLFDIKKNFDSLIK